MGLNAECDMYFFMTNSTQQPSQSFVNLRKSFRNFPILTLLNDISVLNGISVVGLDVNRRTRVLYAALVSSGSIRGYLEISFLSLSLGCHNRTYCYVNQFLLTAFYRSR